MQLSSRTLSLVLLVFGIVMGLSGFLAPNARAQSDKPFVVEYYYKTKWGAINGVGVFQVFSGMDKESVDRI